MWPYVSLKRLKWSRSRSTKLSGRRVARLRSTSAASARSKLRRFATPVRASVSACRASCSRASALAMASSTSSVSRPSRSSASRSRASTGRWRRPVRPDRPVDANGRADGRAPRRLLEEARHRRPVRPDVVDPRLHTGGEDPGQDAVTVEHHRVTGLQRLPGIRAPPDAEAARATLPVPPQRRLVTAHPRGRLLGDALREQSERRPFRDQPRDPADDRMLRVRRPQLPLELPAVGDVLDDAVHDDPRRALGRSRVQPLAHPALRAVDVDAVLDGHRLTAGGARQCLLDPRQILGVRGTGRNGCASGPCGGVPSAGVEPAGEDAQAHSGQRALDVGAGKLRAQLGVGPLHDAGTRLLA